MSENPMISEGSKESPVNKNGSSVGQYMPQVFMVPYYAPHPSYASFPQGQQHQPHPIIGQMPAGMPPGPMPMHGISPIHLAPATIQKEANTTVNSSEASSSKQTANDVTVSKNETPNSTGNVVSPQVQAPRATWSYLEENFLVQTYGEHTKGRQFRKMTKNIWELIAEQLYRESKKRLPQVGLKSWMQCKDKWNNMIKKHKHNRSNQPEREDLFEAIEKVLQHESSHALAVDAEEEENQEKHQDGEESMMVSPKEHVVRQSETQLGQRRTKDGTLQLADFTDASGHDEESSSNYSVPLVCSDVVEKSNEQYHSSEDFAMPSMASLGNRKRLVDEDTNEGYEEGRQKRPKLVPPGESADDKLCRILSKQTELLEEIHTQHCELLEQVRISEVNTRMLVVEAIKDLGRILSSLVEKGNV